MAPSAADEPYCYLTTTGRVSGRPREIEIWFALSADGRVLYMLSGGGDRSDWVRNLLASPAVSVRIGARTVGGRARVLSSSAEEDALARALVVGKYSAGYSGDLSDYRRRALAVAVDLDEPLS